MGNELIPFDDVQRMGLAVAKSGLFGMKTPEQAIALMLVAQAQGRHPATVAMEYDIISNRPAIKSQAALMRFQEAGGKIEWGTRTDAEVSAKFSHPQGGTLTVKWDMERAKKMGLAGKDNWQKQPMIMLQWRVVAEGVRACYPACLGGSYLVEEVQDFDPPKQSKPTESAKPFGFAPKPTKDIGVSTGAEPEDATFEPVPAAPPASQPQAPDPALGPEPTEQELFAKPKGVPPKGPGRPKKNPILINIHAMKAKLEKLPGGEAEYYRILGENYGAEHATELPEDKIMEAAGKIAAKLNELKAK